MCMYNILTGTLMSISARTNMDRVVLLGCERMYVYHFRIRKLVPIHLCTNNDGALLLECEGMYM